MTTTKPVTIGTDLFTLHIKFKRATDLPIGDFLLLSSDPYCVATLRFPGQLYDGDEKFKLHRRTRTLRRELNPEWNEDWTIANVPITGFTLKLKVMDEDAKNHDDGLGVAKIVVTSMSEGKTEYNQGLSIRKAGDVGVTFVRAVAAGCKGKKFKNLGGKIEVDISVEKCAEDVPKDHRPYTVGPNWWSAHYSPLIGIIITKTKTDMPTPSRQSSQVTTSSGVTDAEDSGSGHESSTAGSDNKVQRYNFAANKLQLSGPVPSEMYVKYVAFRPVIKTFYTKAGISGRLLNRALRHQYRTLYSYDRHTEWGILNDHKSIAKRFLELAHWGQGGRVFTYVITVDGEWRFTETGKEFGIQMLSKHTMHSRVAIHVAFAGEFFVRAKKHQNHHIPSDEHHEHHNRYGREGHVEDFELVIDNDSGTYRPDKELLPKLKEFMEKNLEGLAVLVAHCFDDEHQEEKKAHAKQKERRRFRQASLHSNDSDNENSISSSDEEELTTGQLGRRARMKEKAMMKLQAMGEVERPLSSHGHEEQFKNAEKENGETSGRRRFESF